MASLFKCFGCLSPEPVVHGKDPAHAASSSLSEDSKDSADQESLISSEIEVAEVAEDPPKLPRVHSNRVIEVHRALQEKEDALKLPPLQPIGTEDRRSERVFAIHAKFDELTEAAKVPGPESLPSTKNSFGDTRRKSEFIASFHESLETRDREAQEEPRLVKSPSSQSD